MRFTFEQIILFYLIFKEVIFKYYNCHIYLSNVVIQRLIKQKFSQKLSLSLDFDDLTMIRKLSVRNVIKLIYTTGIHANTNVSINKKDESNTNHFR